jgi:hypothetical protein
MASICKKVCLTKKKNVILINEKYQNCIGGLEQQLPCRADLPVVAVAASVDALV